MNVLVTGAAGYIGSTLCPALLAAGHRVIAIDNYRYGMAHATALAACCADPRFDFYKGDARDMRVLRPHLRTADVVIPLAAIVGQPACDADPFAAVSTNHIAIKTLMGELSSQLVVYPNSNSGYGRMPEGSNTPLSEESPLNPLSIYAKTKQSGEDVVLDRHPSIVFRLATVYGASPRHRTDLLVNDFTLRAARDGYIHLYEPNARRNFVHVRDVARAFMWASEAQTQQVFNLGRQDANLTKVQLCASIARHTSFRWSEGEGADPDARDYVIANDKVLNAGFTFEHTLDSGISELLKLYQAFPTSAWGNI